jgi:hypothetical protein
MLLESGGPWEFGDEDARDLGEADMGGFVYNGSHGIQAIAEFGEALFEFDGFGFLHSSS